ncbi:agmatine deiminase family protein [Streptomyces sp. NBC_00257]|uniref:agmatine deiminase family protein n=1 Tax=unclassified Streptomyces TaxID=2593676 RepID=UPI000F5BC9DE|nr:MULTISPECIES: agmatine deiminase family protein [unclassified Streptomyces]WSG53955.1 agmatine deiminase family protein [Streptomyces sp. NBC_01732]WSX04588.1 agmatine deiminase family protein [Streptomyces sp. NBC_00987]MCX4393144.1 agmatine deiminase family protein [Streptomyces sp. NBC_01767]MCX5163585.1 agmatine deiminase family protein [Streptomyces sp. NBC_00305]MCX5222109.1 agmatine deiminase family protein [Streptomyces sp. NBC_00264]
MPHHLPSRRSALRSIAGIGAAVLGASSCGPGESATGPSGTGNEDAMTKGRRMGAEWESHARTFMSWPALESVWGEDLRYVREDIARIAHAVAEYEYVVMLARPDQQKAAQKACGRDVEVVPLAVDDLWARDTVPVFVEDDGKVTGIDFNFNGWGNKQQHTNDARVGRTLLTAYDIPRSKAPLIAEGGSFETDGEGTLLITESSIVNDNRNPGKSRDRIEAELKQTLGVKKVIWLAGVRGQDITDAHVDSLVRFTAPGVVLLDKAHPDTPADSWSRAADQAKSVLSRATDAKGRPFEIIDLPQPDLYEITGEGDDFVSTYANFYVANDSVFIPGFGDRKSDKRAKSILREHFPGRDIVQINIDTIASGGGGIHCSTHDEPGKPVD